MNPYLLLLTILLSQAVVLAVVATLEAAVVQAD
jgi:hypothetical protein